MDKLHDASLDAILSTWGFTRGPDETDDHLRERLARILRWPEGKYRNNQYLRLCLLLARLGVNTARRDLPIGVL